jgi:uncharacterized protein
VLPYADIRQTHSAVVFFVGDRACKLKRPVSLGFLDFSTLQARDAACQREIRAEPAVRACADTATRVPG